MISLKEGLLNKKNIKDIQSRTRNFNVRDFESGDIAIMRDGSPCLVVYRKDIPSEYTYYGITVCETGSLVHPALYEDEFTGLALYNYSDNGKMNGSMNDLDIVEVFPKQCTSKIYKYPHKLWKYLNDFKRALNL